MDRDEAAEWESLRRRLLFGFDTETTTGTPADGATLIATGEYHSIDELPRKQALALCDAFNVPPHVVTGSTRRRTWRLRRRLRMSMRARARRRRADE